MTTNDYSILIIRSKYAVLRGLGRNMAAGGALNRQAPGTIQMRFEEGL
jgi:hypothetical protein